jgi:hypothetical protein
MILRLLFLGELDDVHVGLHFKLADTAGTGTPAAKAITSSRPS